MQHKMMNLSINSIIFCKKNSSMSSIILKTCSLVNDKKMLEEDDAFEMAEDKSPVILSNCYALKQHEMHLTMFEE
jgi:hypothetical protein